MCVTSWLLLGNLQLAVAPLGLRWGAKCTRIVRSSDSDSPPDGLILVLVLILIRIRILILFAFVVLHIFIGL